MGNRPFPSICASGSLPDRLCAYDGSETAFSETPTAAIARHDLILLRVEDFGLRWSGRFPGESTRLVPASVEKARKWRTELTRLNPNAIVLADLPYIEAPVDRFPMSSAIWLRDPKGHIITTITDTGIRGHLRFDRPPFPALLESQASALMASRVVDGVALRTWTEDSPARLALVQAVRRGVGRSGVIVIGSGVATPTLSGPYVNGTLIVDDGKGRPIWPKFQSACDWARDHVRKPSFTILEVHATRARTQLYEMRMATTLGLVFGDGFVSFGDSSGHDWYEFWAPSLGRPVGKAFRKDGAYWREYQNGTAVFNPPTNPTVTLSFSSLHTSVAKSLSTRRVSVQPGDGDILLSRPPARS